MQVVISRRDAADSGKKHYFTGEPCKHGHTSPRYVTNGGCVACARSLFVPKHNPWTKELMPFTNANLWAATRFSKAQRIALRVYLQKCIFTFTRAQFENMEFKVQVELEAAMQEIEERPRFTQPDDPKCTD